MVLQMGFWMDFGQKRVFLITKKWKREWEPKVGKGTRVNGMNKMKRENEDNRAKTRLADKEAKEWVIARILFSVTCKMHSLRRN